MKSGSRNILLKIPSVLYGWGVGVRNFLYDEGIRKGYKSSIPVICIGNVAVGGTGKTPHVERVIRMLRDDYRIAVLTRGYGRSSKGPVVASVDDDAATIGDEPLQMKRKFPEIIVYVDGDRRRALRNLELMPEPFRPEVVIMDDGFQHRRVTPAYSIVLTSYEQPFTRDTFLPYGNLRDAAASVDRAESIIVTHTPDDCKPIDLRMMMGELPLKDYQDVYFSRLEYGDVRPLYEPEAMVTHRLTREQCVTAIAGVGDPSYFFREVQRLFPRTEELVAYDDHHDFTERDIDEMREMLAGEGEPRFLLTTEKDGMRLLRHADRFTEEERRRIWYLPIEVTLSPKQERRLLDRLHRAIKNNGLHL